jgi:hypothetical protein
MKLFQTRETNLDYVLIILFLLFILLQIEIPQVLAEVVDTPFGMGIIIISALYLFFYTNPILGVLGLIAAYEILRRSAKQTGNYGFKYLPSQESRDRQFTQMNSSDIVGAAPAAGSGETLEEQIISTMAPIQGAAKNTDYVETSFKPMMESIENM